MRLLLPLDFWVDYLTTTLARSGAGKKGAALIPVVAYDVWITTMRAHLPADTYLPWPESLRQQRTQSTHLLA